MYKAMKVLAGACALALAFALVGCSQGSSSSAASDGSSGASAASAESSDAQSASSEQSEPASDAADSASSSAADSSVAALPNGVYSVAVDTDSSMFHVNEADEGRGVLTVTDEGMTLHMRLVSKKIVNLYAGTAAQAAEDPDGIVEPTTDKVTYSDGTEKEVYGFDIPVPALDQAFDVAILGAKGNWYDHKVTISDPIAE